MLFSRMYQSKKALLLVVDAVTTIEDLSWGAMGCWLC